GTSRKSGKTTLVCEIISATPGASWIAVKITPHGHGRELTSPIAMKETEAGADSDTARFLKSGAREAWWIRAGPDQIPDVLEGLPRGNRIIESNAAAGIVPSDLLIFVVDPDAGEWKLSANHIRHA